MKILRRVNQLEAHIWNQIEKRWSNNVFCKYWYYWSNERLQEFLTKAIDDSGQKEIQTENHILKPRNYKDSVIVESTKDLPIDYIVCSEVVKPNKKLIYEDIKKGKSIRGAHLKSNRKTVIK